MGQNVFGEADTAFRFFRIKKPELRGCCLPLPMPLSRQSHDPPERHPLSNCKF